MKAILIIIALLIIYGSLYPFNLVFTPNSSLSLQALFNFNVIKTDITNLIANIVLFVPFGLLLSAAYPKSRSSSNYAKHTLVFLILTFIFAFAIQALQLFTEDRLPWGGDAILNTVGCAIGLFLYSIVRLDISKPLQSFSVEQQISFAIALTIITLEFAPFAPSIDFDVLKQNIKAVLNAPNIEWYWLFENTVFWLVSFFCIKTASPQFARSRNLSIVVAIVLFSKFIIISSNIDLSQLLAGVLSVAIWRAFSTRLTALHLAILLLLSILGNGLYPFELRAQATTFHWLPFTGSMGGNILLNILAFMKKLVFYGGVIWLFYLAKRSLLLGTMLCALIVLLSEFLQTLFTNSVPESTDVLLTLLVAFMFAQILKLKSAQDAELNIGNSRGENVSDRNAEDDKIYSFALHKENISTSSSRKKNLSSQYMPGLDGLRAVAALSVFFVHFQQFSGLKGTLGFIDFERWMINGNTGVALFFVLSGFLLSMPFWQGIKEANYPNIKQYFVNRVVRILPIYYLCLFGLLALKGFQGADANFNNIVSHLFFLHNLKDQQVMSLNPPFWTLAVEFQFYLLLPVLFLLLFKLGLRKAQWLCLMLIPSIYFAYRYFMQQMTLNEDWPIAIALIWPFGINIGSASGQSLTYSLFAHLPHFLIGLFAASLYTSRISKIAEAIFWASAMLVFIILTTELDSFLQLDFGRYNFPFVPILLGLIVFTAPKTKWASACLEFAPLKWVGVISYGVYIFHYPIQKATLKVFELLDMSVAGQAALYAMITLVITLALSHLSYKMIERPILSHFRQRKSASIKHYVPAAITKVETKTMVNSQVKTKFWLPTLSVIVIAVAVGFSYVWNTDKAKISIEQPHWAGSKSERIIFDHHAHTLYSDGDKSVAELTELAYLKGCDAFSITDHTQNFNSFTNIKLAEIRAMRDKYPVMLIFAGIELGMPSYLGREHVNVITTPEFEEQTLSSIINALQTSSEMEKRARDFHVLNAINEIENAKNNTVAIYNHPSRKDLNEENDENYTDTLFWNQNSSVITAFAGAPGHQRKAEIGSYETKILPIDRWDPVVATVGGTWDQLLVKGHRIWGAIASSDYHNDVMDYGPCEFARIHVAAPTKDYSGLIAGIKAGTFWADHGKLLKSYDFNVSVDGSERVYPGGTIALANNTHILAVEINVERNTQFSQDFLRVDLITNCNATEVYANSEIMAPEESSMSVFLPVAEDAGACFLRSRVVRETPEENDLSAYSNPIFVDFK